MTMMLCMLKRSQLCEGHQPIVWITMAPVQEQNFYFFRTLIFAFTLGLWLLVTQEVSGMGAISWNGPFVQLDAGWLLPQPLCHYCSRVFHKQDSIVELRLCGWVGVLVSFLVARSVPSHTQTLEYRDIDSRQVPAPPFYV